jgi:hypothetical protein
MRKAKIKIRAQGVPVKSSGLKTRLFLVSDFCHQKNDNLDIPAA